MLAVLGLCIAGLKILRIMEKEEEPGRNCCAAESAQTSCSRHCELSGEAAHAGPRGGRALRHFTGNFFSFFPPIQRLCVEHVYNARP